MNTHERTVSDALRAYGEGLEMTTQDVERLEQSLDHRRQTRRQDKRGRIWQAAIAACAVTGVVLGGLALRHDLEPPKVPTAPAQAVLGLEGIWRVDDGSGYLWTFAADGALRYTPEPYDPLVNTDSSGIPSSTYRYIPGGVVLHGADDCDDAFATSLSADGRVRATFTGTTGKSCPPQAAPNLSSPPEVWELTRVSPASAAGATLKPQQPTVEAFAVGDLSNLVGTWLFPASGTLLTVTRTGDYAVRTFDTLNRPERGTVAVTGKGSLVFTPSGSRSCTAVYTSVTSRGSSLDATLAGGSCARLTGATDTWVRIN